MLKAVFWGVVGSIVAAALERGIISGVFSRDVFFVFQGGRTLTTFRDLLAGFGIAFFLMALPEEFIKFFIFKWRFFQRRDFNQIIDGIKIGIVLGLGFAFVENFYFFFAEASNVWFEPENFLFTLVLRFFVATLAHSLYGAVLGYYFGLARSYKIFSGIFLWQGIVAATAFHALFNFLALTPFNIFTFILIIAMLLISLRWYTDRKNLQMAISKNKTIKHPPLFIGEKEMKAIIAEETGSNFRVVKKLGLCPYCFRKLSITKNGLCAYCGGKIEKDKK